ncbi:myogenesis-regulating glycosidase-like [Saccoglossus kowalevskii]
MFRFSKRVQQTIAALLSTFMVTGLLAWYYIIQHGHTVVLQLGPLELDSGLQQLTVGDSNNEGKKLIIDIGKHLSMTSIPMQCEDVGGRMNLCIEWIEDESERSNLKIAQMRVDLNTIDTKATCYEVKWQVMSHNFVPEDCISFGNEHWYGGAVAYRQYLVLEKGHVSMQPYVTGDIWDNAKGYGSVLDRIWMSSHGMMIVVPDTVPLHVSVNQPTGYFCLKADYTDSSYKSYDDKFVNLKYTICDAKNIRDIQEYVQVRYLFPPNGKPDESVVNFPIWNIRSYDMNTYTNQSDVLDIAAQIKQHSFNHSQLVISDRYSMHHGDLTFDPNRFPDPGLMADSLHEMGFRIGLKVNLFSSVMSEAFKEGSRKGFWVTYGESDVPGLVKRYGNVGVLLDLTNEKAKSWYKKRLSNLLSHVDVLHFDGGQAQYLPYQYDVHRTYLMRNPNMYSKMFVQLATDLGNQNQLQSGWGTQRYPIFLRMSEKNSGWCYSNGLKSVIPTVLLYGILGYPYVIPAAIGGNPMGNTDMDVKTEGLPERELYIRWMQVVTYLPVMEFTTLPWQYDAEVVRIAHKLVKIHEVIVAPMINNLTLESVQNGAPIIRPVWWVAPNDPNTLALDTEFLIGDDFLVAPILEKDARKRDIYLPKGDWKALLNGNIYEGEKWIRDFPIELDAIATFQRMDTLS